MLGRRAFAGAIGLIGAIVAFPVKGITAMTEAKIVSDARASADWIARALTSSSYKADFSMESLREVDRFFDDHAPGGTVRQDGLLSEDLGARIFAIGSYVGETLRRLLGGDWEGSDGDPQAEINLALKLRNGTIVWPVQRAMKRLKNGKEDSIAAYGAALARP